MDRELFKRHLNKAEDFHQQHVSVNTHSLPLVFWNDIIGLRLFLYAVALSFLR